MTQPATVGTLSQCAIGIGTPTVAFEYKNFGLMLHQEIIPTNGIRGTHNHPAERTRLGKAICSGGISLQPGPHDIDTLMPLITGTVKNGSNQFPLAETLLAFNTVVDRVVKVYTYANCYVDRCVIRASQGEPIDLELQVESLTETIANAGTFAGTFNYQSPYVWYDGALTVGGTAYQFLECVITIDNHLKKDRFMNSVTRTDLPFLDRTIEAELRLPATTDQATLLAYTGITAESFSLVFTQGIDSLTIASSAFQIEPQAPTTPGREELLLPLRGQFRSSSAGTVPSLTVTNIST